MTREERIKEILDRECREKHLRLRHEYDRDRLRTDGPRCKELAEIKDVQVCSTTSRRVFA